MNFLDIVIIVPLIYACWKGFKKGLIIEIFTLLALLVGLYVAIHFSDWTSLKIEHNLDSKPKYLPIISFTLTFLAVGAMVYFLGKTLEKLISIAQLGLVNKLLGVLFSLLKMLYLIGIFIVMIESYDTKNNFIPEKNKTESLLYQPVKSMTVKTLPFIEDAKFYAKTLASDTLVEQDSLTPQPKN